MIVNLPSWLKDETAIVVELKGIWAKNVDLPKLNSKVAVSLEGIVLKEKEAGPGQGSVGVIFAAGVKMKWGKASVDGFQRESLEGRKQGGRKERSSSPLRD